MHHKMFEPPKIPEKYMRNFLIKAPMVHMHVIRLLMKEPMCGNRIAEEISPKMPGHEPKKVNPNIVYPMLHYLEEQGYIKGRWEHPKKRTRRIYEITPEGRKMFFRLRKMMRPKIREMLKMMKLMAKDIFGLKE